ncbi:hypothetical protein CPSG_03410 [Coccidioides posadasii str. Silveira]|uniref:Uncharacterized protein n=1 Tax=Coccidioides posadasii (strain RMSCC 757 / Silveira) TaxID=443226 RepID=E9CZY2_COCPS|nr:hypothetical protein CPSG_03410 [Coccidioides posadasii str. Silveira]
MLYFCVVRLQGLLTYHLRPISFQRPSSQEFLTLWACLVCSQASDIQTSKPTKLSSHSHIQAPFRFPYRYPFSQATLPAGTFPQKPVSKRPRRVTHHLDSPNGASNTTRQSLRKSCTRNQQLYVPYRIRRA